jgi:hypothetical protein
MTGLGRNDRLTPSGSSQNKQICKPADNGSQANAG